MKFYVIKFGLIGETSWYSLSFGTESGRDRIVRMIRDKEFIYMGDGLHVNGAFIRGFIIENLGNEQIESKKEQ